MMAPPAVPLPGGEESSPEEYAEWQPLKEAIQSMAPAGTAIAAIDQATAPPLLMLTLQSLKAAVLRFERVKASAHIEMCVSLSSAADELTLWIKECAPKLFKADIGRSVLSQMLRKAKHDPTAQAWRLTSSLWQTAADRQWWKEQLSHQDQLQVKSFNQCKALHQYRGDIDRAHPEPAARRAFWSSVFSAMRTQLETVKFIQTHCPPNNTAVIEPAAASAAVTCTATPAAATAVAPTDAAASSPNSSLAAPAALPESSAAPLEVAEPSPAPLQPLDSNDQLIAPNERTSMELEPTSPVAAEESPAQAAASADADAAAAEESPAQAASALSLGHAQLHLADSPRSEDDAGHIPGRRTTRAAAAAHNAPPPPLVHLSAGAPAAATLAAATAFSAPPQRQAAKAAAARAKTKRARIVSDDEESDVEDSASESDSSDDDDSSSSNGELSSVVSSSISTPPRVQGRVRAAKKPMLAASEAALKIVPLDVKVLSGQTERLEQGAFSLPLTDSFHFATGNLATHSLVLDLCQHQAVLVTPAANHVEQLRLDGAMRDPSVFKEAASMTLGCGNNNGVAVSPPASLDKEMAHGVWNVVPSECAVFTFLDADWAAVSAGDVPPAVPDLMRDRQYVKDQSERFDVNDEPNRRAFFPQQDEQLEKLLDQCAPEPASSRTWGTKKEFAARRVWLRQRWVQLEQLRANQKKKKMNNFSAESFIHPLFLNELQLHRRSLANLSQVDFDGVLSYFLYLKVGFQFFNLHIEQMLFPFVHHQLEGETRWFIIPHAELDKLYALAAEMYGVLYGVQGRTAVHDQERAIMGRALLYSKQLFPPLSLLKQHGITFRSITLRAGQVLMAHGGDAHFGFSTVPGRTVAVATNVATSAWLKDGLPFVLAHFKWISEVLEPWWRSAGCELKVAKNSPAALRDMLTHDAMVDKCIMLCPPNFACSFIRGINADLAALEKHCVPVCEYRAEDVAAADMPQHRERCAEILRLLHACRPFTIKECPSCSKSSNRGKPTDCSCMSCHCRAGDANEEWLDGLTCGKRTAASAVLGDGRASQRRKLNEDHVLTLQHSNHSWPQASLSVSEVPLLPVTQLDQLGDTVRGAGVAHVSDVLGSDLLDEINKELKPWLDELLVKMSQQMRNMSTGVTIELTKESIREVEHNQPLLVAAPAFAHTLVQRILNDPCLGRLVQQIGHPDAQVYEAIYLRLRLPGHYTRLHSDNSFFRDRDLLAAEPVGTVWIPLQTCAPATGALLLLPETHNLQQTGSAVSPAFDIERWKHLGAAGGYTVASADMPLGNALLFNRHVVHGGALRSDSSSGARYSIDLRILAKPELAPILDGDDSDSCTERINMVTMAALHLLDAELIPQQVSSAKKINALLNDAYIFFLFLRSHQGRHPALRKRLSAFFASVQPVLRPFFEAPPTSPKALDARQRAQYRTIWHDSAAAEGGGSVPMECDSGSEADAAASADQAAATVSQAAKDHPTFKSMLLELTSALDSDGDVKALEVHLPSWTTVVKSYTTTVCFQAIVDGHGHSTQLRGYCTQTNELWALLQKHPDWQNKFIDAGQEKQDDCKWKEFVVVILYLATHCVYAQTLYQTHCAKAVASIVGYDHIAKLLRHDKLIQKLIQWDHAELFAEILAVLQLDLAVHERDVDAIWRWLLQVWFPKGKNKNAGKGIAALCKNRCGSAFKLHLVSTLLLALPHPAGSVRHPLLAEPLDPVFSALPQLHADSKSELQNVELYIDEALSTRQLHQPIQIGLRASQDIALGADVTLYGGKPLGAAAVRKANIPSPTSHACTIADLNNMWVMDGRPFAMMIRRPVPVDEAGLQVIVAAGVEALLPDAVRDGYSPAEMEAFTSTPLGFMANCDVVQEPNMKLSWLSFNGGLCRLPQLVATRAISRGEPLTWKYNNNERRELLQALKELHCDVCLSELSPDDNPIICCDFTNDCINGRHRNCFQGGEMPPLDPAALVRFRHRCAAHPIRKPRAAATASVAAAAALASERPQHNLPSIRSLQQPASSSAASSSSAQQIYLPALEWEKGLKWNSEQQGVVVRTSTIANAGNGLFASRDFKRGDLIGWLWGMFVTEAEWQQMVNDQLDPAHAIFQADAADGLTEDFRAEIRLGVWRCIHPEGVCDQQEEYRMLVSRQCPMGLINDPRGDRNAKPNVEIVTDSSIKNTSWQLVSVRATKAIKQGVELFIDYAWKEEAWTEMRKRALTNKEELNKRAASLAASQLHEPTPAAADSSAAAAASQ